MKKFVVVALGVFAALTAAFVLTQQAQAASQDECAIWLCLPGGFPSGCGAAHSAMVKRLKDRKSPLPSFSACAAENPKPGSGSHMTSRIGYAALIPSRKVCTQYKRNGRTCVSWKTVEAHYVDGKKCLESGYDGSHYTMTPPGCIKTVDWAEVLVEGKLAGERYYW
jgi:hypothetical protein